jgi:hypothetical protein
MPERALLREPCPGSSLRGRLETTSPMRIKTSAPSPKGCFTAMPFAIVRRRIGVGTILIAACRLVSDEADERTIRIVALKFLTILASE